MGVVVGLATVLVVCATGNFASATTIERLAGVVEEIRPATRGPVRRYWMTR
ncbi:hypothetical protein [Amycolatopsis sp. NPDC051128]|uniref:hypothetical protein n=1 Tax=Amycolatopsis sp. NPDC051128 TaxID=3155412 RepID=UPI003429CAAB